ncbi:MAG: cellulase family glycosylhydrolase [Flavobacteriaceae bacterium]|nr:cellulase family glycosylhydrolase [Flavobacteriaceae bacterium]
MAQWKQISVYFKGYPENLVFEILNEPHGNLSAAKWNQFIVSALAEIRTDNPDRIVMIGTADWGGLGGLSQLNIPNDQNLILTIHYYNPFRFTHQGAEWVNDSQAWLGTEWLDSQDERTTVEREFAPLLKLSEEKKIPIHIGEFGAYAKADLVSRSKWTTFLSRYFEQKKMEFGLLGIQCGFWYL